MNGWWQKPEPECYRRPRNLHFGRRWRFEYSTSNNYLIYHEPTTRRWTVLPWGTDQTFKADSPLANIQFELLDGIHATTLANRPLTSCASFLEKSGRK